MVRIVIGSDSNVLRNARRVKSDDGLKKLDAAKIATTTWERKQGQTEVRLILDG